MVKLSIQPLLADMNNLYHLHYVKIKKNYHFICDIELVAAEIPDDSVSKSEIKYFGDSPIFDAHIEYKCILTDKLFTKFYMNECIGIFIRPKGANQVYDDLTMGNWV